MSYVLTTFCVLISGAFIVFDDWRSDHTQRETVGLIDHLHVVIQACEGCLGLFQCVFAPLTSMDNHFSKQLIRF